MADFFAASPRCFVIGGNKVAIRCCEILLRHGFDIKGTVTDEETFRIWSLQHRIPIISQREDLYEHLVEKPFEYLFSIFNTRILSRLILELPLRFAVNYHDALLPNYAGLYAPTWALINRETVHGITWHKIDSDIDTGDILKQRAFEVESGETSLSLNQRCFKEAIESFAELAGELQAGGESAQPQDLKKRSYFRRHQRPSGAGIIQWNKNAADLEALVRALNFGPFENPLLLPKVLLDKGVFIATEAHRKNPTHDNVPGTIVDSGLNSLTVATATENLVLSDFKTLSGLPLNWDQYRNFNRLNPGDRLPILQDEAIQRLDVITAAVAREESFWVERLESSKNFAFFSNPSSEHQNPRTSRFEWSFPTSTFQFIKSQRNERASQEFLLAALAAYLARISGENLFDLDYPVTDRRIQEFGEIFASRVPFRFEIDSEHSFEILLTSVRTEMEKIKQKTTYFSDLPGRRPNLFLRIGVPKRIAIGWLEDECSAELKGAPILFLLSKCTANAMVLLDANAVDEQSLRTFVEGFCEFAAKLVIATKTPLCEIPLISTGQLSQWLTMADGPVPNLLPDQCVHELIAKNTLRTPNATAVEHEGLSITYAELDDQANRLARVLLKAGAGPDRLIAIYLPRSLGMIVAVLAVLKAGAAYLPIDPTMPDERLNLILREAMPCALINSDKTARTASLTAETTVINLDEALTDPDNSRGPELPVKSELHHLAYVIYTSGSSGKPKGVLIEHRSLVHYAVTAVWQFQVKAADRMLQFASLGFDASAEEIFTCLLAGATLVLRIDAMIKSPDSFLACCKEWRLTILDLPTAYWTHLMTAMSKKKKGFPREIRLVLIGGERVTPEALAEWYESAHHPTLWNTYGPTEATIVSAWCDLTVPTGDARGEVPVGRPIPGVCAYIVDSRLQPVPMGGAGELLIGGLGLSRGYLRRPELTFQKFVEIKFSNHPRLRLYRTGDRFKYRADGNLEYLGRLDDQVKIRGNRVEPGEIESLLATHPEVAECAVVPRKENADAIFLACFFVPKDGLLSAELLREWLRQRLPEYLIPARFSSISRLPLTQSGKIDRRNLQERINVPWEVEAIVVPAFTETQRLIVAIWESLLGVAPIGIRTSFFALGGDSLQAVLINVEIEKTFHLEPSLKWVFEHPTIEGLAREVDLLQSSRRTSEPTGITELRQLWESVLLVGPIGRYDNIFAKGAARSDIPRLAAAMSAHCRIELPLRAITDRPTLAQMAEYIDGRKSRQGLSWWRSLIWGQRSEQIVPLRRGGDLAPLFIYPGGWVREAELLIFAAMIPHFPTGFPIYGLKQNYAVRASRVAWTLPEIAKNFLLEIRRVQPTGPFHLLGECVSWVVVMEMARQLSAQKEKIASVTLLDPLRPGFLRSGGDSKEFNMPRKVRRYYRVLAKGPSLPYSETVNIISLDDPQSARHRLKDWGVFQHSLLHIRQARGNHHTYTREYGPEIARLIGDVLNG